MTNSPITTASLAALTITLAALPSLAQETNPGTSPGSPAIPSLRGAIPATPLTPSTRTAEVPVSVSASAVSRDGRPVTASAQCKAVSDGTGPSDVSDSSTVTSEDGTVTVSVSCRAATNSTPTSHYSYKSTTTVIRSGPAKTSPTAQPRQ